MAVTLPISSVESLTSSSCTSLPDASTDDWMTRGSSFSTSTSTDDVPRMRAWIRGTATTSTTRPMTNMSFLFMTPLSQRKDRSDEHDDSQRPEHDDGGRYDRALREGLIAEDLQHGGPQHRDVELHQDALDDRRSLRIEG